MRYYKVGYDNNKGEQQVENAGLWGGYLWNEGIEKPSQRGILRWLLKDGQELDGTNKSSCDSQWKNKNLGCKQRHGWKQKGNLTTFSGSDTQNKWMVARGERGWGTG